MSATPECTGANDAAPVAVVALTAAGAVTGRAAVAALDRAELHGRDGRVESATVYFAETTAHLRALFDAGRPIVALCAAGIVVRALADRLTDKGTEPPVLAVSEDGASVVPLLGGHRGANALARRLAAALGGHAAVTTAGDVALGFALDDPPAGWRLADPAPVKAVTAAMLAGEPVRLLREAGPADWPVPPAVAADAGPTIRVTDRHPAALAAEAPDGDPARTVTLYPPVLALGVGCERHADASGLVDFVTETLAEKGLAAEAVGAVGTVDLKADEPAMAALSQALGRPLRLFEAAALEREAKRLANPSEAVFREIGCHGVAEAAALALAGPAATLAVEKIKRGPYTLAVARAANGATVDATAGRGRGRLFVVGIGPGTAAWRTEEARAAIAAADAVVGYRLYLDLATDLIGDKPTFESDLGAEAARADKALDLAAEGRTVALVCSGDPGIYALATLVFERAEALRAAAGEAGARTLEAVSITVVPGISAFQAAAARLGAPVGHDFCLVSLSDLLTPRAAILRRLDAAAAGDFVACLYNPQSRRRRTLLPEAVARFAAARPGDTPVAVCRNLGRPDERIALSTLDTFDPETVDMLSLVLIGSSTTRRLDRPDGARLFTPRGYADKETPGDTAATAAGPGAEAEMPS